MEIWVLLWKIVIDLFSAWSIFSFVGCGIASGSVHLVEIMEEIWHVIKGNLSSQITNYQHIIILGDEFYIGTLQIGCPYS